MICPICKKDAEPGNPYIPFCSDRCRLIDLANWADGTYRIPAQEEPAGEQEDEDREA